MTNIVSIKGGTVNGNTINGDTVTKPGICRLYLISGKNANSGRGPGSHFTGYLAEDKFLAVAALVDMKQLVTITGTAKDAQDGRQEFELVSYTSP